MVQLHLVSHTPGLLSFGHTAAGQRGLFEYPLIQVTLLVHCLIIFLFHKQT